MSGISFFSELRQRKVVQVAVIYVAVAWGVTEILVTVVEQLFLPQWVSTLAVIGFVVGFPVAMFLAWIFDFTAEGIQRTTVTSRRGKASIAASMLLLIAGTAGLFLLIKPTLQSQEASRLPSDIPSNSIAILPFENTSLDPNDLYLSEGLSDELRDQVGRVPGLRVAARSSSIAVREEGKGARAMSALLGVANLVEGSLRRHGNILRVSVQLIEGSSGLTIWSETFERGPKELLSVQQAIADAVVRQVLPESGEVVAGPATRDATANELMLLARHYEQQVRTRQEVDVDTLNEGIRLYREATEADPESALAHSRLAGALLYLGDVDSAEAPIFKALSLAPNLSEVQNTLGEFYWARGRPEAGTAWARAVEIDPNNPDALNSYALWRWYRIEIEGVEEMFRRALELDPLNLERYGALGSYLAAENHPEGAREVVSRVEELFKGAASYRVIADLLDRLGDVDQSIAWTIRARDLEPDNPSHVEKLAEYYADMGDFKTALDLDPGGIGILFKMRRYGELIDAAEFLMIEEPEDFWLRTLLAMAYNATGQFESSVHVLSTTGLPDSVFNGWRSTAEWDGYMTLMNALYGHGEIEMAQNLAQWAVDYGSTVNYDWWPNTYEACQRAILGRDGEVRDYLERLQKGVHLLWDPYLKDWPCFDRFADDPVYQAAILYFDERRVMLRARLPATLAEFGVKL